MEIQFEARRAETLPTAVNNIQPGPTVTDMTVDLIEAIKPLIPLKRAADPDEIAGLVAYLASKESGYISQACATAGRVGRYECDERGFCDTEACCSSACTRNCFIVGFECGSVCRSLNKVRKKPNGACKKTVIPRAMRAKDLRGIYARRRISFLQFDGRAPTMSSASAIFSISVLPSPR